MKNLRLYGLGLVAALGLASGLAFGAASVGIPVPYVTALGDTDVVQIIKGGVPSAQNVYSSLASLRSYILGGSISHTGVPVLTSCITGGGTIVGNDYAFILTGGSTASTSCVATFAAAYTATPVCSLSSQTAYGTTTASYTVSTSAVTITQASGSSNVYNVICVGQDGG